MNKINTLRTNIHWLAELKYRLTSISTIIDSYTNYKTYYWCFAEYGNVNSNKYLEIPEEVIISEDISTNKRLLEVIEEVSNE